MSASEEREDETKAQKREVEEGEEENEVKKQKKLYDSEPSDRKQEHVKEGAEEQQHSEVEEEEEEGTEGGVHKWQGETPEIFPGKQPEPERDEDGYLVFKDHPDFRPNLTPKEVIQRGSFGGTYFRPIYSDVLGHDIEGDWKEYPEDWFQGLDPVKDCCKAWEDYDKDINTYKKKCGRELWFWQDKGWISPIDPRGWFQWYCRFYLGRRSEDDERQIGRATRLMGPHGRFRTQLINRCVKAGKHFDDTSISPVIRQVLQHWGYQLTEKDFKAYCEEKGYEV